MSRRILHCIPSMAGGGAERQLAYLAGALPAEGWDVHVALLHGGVNMERLERNQTTVHRLRASHPYSPGTLFEIWRLVKRVKPDLMQTWLVPMDIVAGEVASRRSVPWILSERSSSVHWLPKWQQAARRYAARSASAIIANSVAGERFWSALRPNVRRFVVPNAIALEEIERTAPASLDAYRRTPATKLVLAVGRVDEGKNYLRLIDAVSLAAKRCDIVALICGSGPDDQLTQAAIDAAQLRERVIMAGFVNDIWSWMRAADLFISLSTFEGLPNAVMEAAACGLPLLLSDISGHRELVDDGAAWFVDHRDTEAVASAMVSALNDDAERRRRASAAAAAARQWSISAMAAHYAEIYDLILSRN